MPLRAPPVELVFHPVRTESDGLPSDAFAAAIMGVLDAALGEICLVSPYLSHNVLLSIVAERSFRLVTDLDACFEGNVDAELVAFLSTNVDRVHDLPGVHAKVVLNDGAALVGSANLTGQGLGARDELSCLIREPMLVEKLQQWFEDLFGVATPVDLLRIETAANRGRLLAGARASVETATKTGVRGVNRARRTLGWLGSKSEKARGESPTVASGSTVFEIAPPVIFDVPWNEYVALVLAQEDRPVVRIRELTGQPSYLGISRVVSELFGQKKRLANMTEDERWKIFQPYKDMPYFGMMFAPSHFKKIMLHEPVLLDSALDEIPEVGAVSRLQFECFVRNLPSPGSGVVTSTRLLAMKRPDLFLCLDSRNRRGIGARFGMSEGSLGKFDGFWELMSRVWRCQWASSEQPADALEAAVWRVRVAIMDAFCVG